MSYTYIERRDNIIIIYIYTYHVEEYYHNI